MSGITILAVAF